MSDRNHPLALSRILQLHYLPAAVALAAMAFIIFFADWQVRYSSERDTRQQVSEALSKIRTRLENDINGNVKLVQGYVAALETETGMTQERYSELGARIIKGDTPIRNVAAAPGFVVSLVYPVKGNERVVGLDYTKNEAQRAAALKVRDTRQLLLTGPVKLVQGGQAVIARFPVIDVRPDGNEHFWGIVSAVLDLEALYRNAGLHADDLAIDVAIETEKSGKVNPEPFFGQASILAQDPVEMTMALGHEDWRLSAIPKGGWGMPRLQLWGIRALLALVAFIVIAPMIWTGRLTEERERHLKILREQEDEMQAMSQRLQVALDTSKIGVWDYDTATGALVWDGRMQDLYDVGLPDGKASYADWKGSLHPGDIKRCEQEFARAIESDQPYQSDFRVVCRNGEIRYIRAMGTTYRDSLGHKKIVGVNWDVTSDIRLQEDLRRAKQVSDLQNEQLEEARLVMESAALHDALTGLPNRRYLDRIVAEHEARSPDEAGLTVMHIDLDRFKDINDTLGHAAGDLILKHASTTLSESIRPGDFIARIGGDEFVIISREAAGAEDYTEIAAHLIDAISRPIDYEGHECRVGASIGIAARSHDEKLDQVLVNADIALYEAKRRGRNRVEKFSDGLRLAAVNTKKTADEILRGLEQNEFVAWFQPQFDATSLEIVGIEALARWDHPSKGVLAPDAFLKIAESVKVVSAIDDVVLTQALLQRYRLEANGISIPKVSVNVSAQRLRDETLVDKLKALSFQPGTLSFELLESTSFDGHDGELIPQIDKIRALGIDIEIDDFGTGYASIVTFLKLTPKRLKIDRQLIAPIIESSEHQRLVRSIIDIGRARGIEIVAEGVETMQHVDILRDLGCQVLQGYALSKPLSPGELLTFVRERRWLQRPASLAS